MTTGDRNSAASIRARLLNRAKQDGTEFQRILVQYANERFLYRLSCSTHADAFVLKGASLFALWSTRIPRATKDVDLLGVGAPSLERLRIVFDEILSTEVTADGMEFDSASLQAQHIREEAVYHGVRLTFRARLSSAVVPLQVDVGFGDLVDPAPASALYPSLLGQESARLRMYAPEVAIAEKYHAMVHLGMTNSRMKDYFDIAFLAERREFEANVLGRAIAGTFARRETALPTELPQGLLDEFAADTRKSQLWRGFLRRVDDAAKLTLEDAVSVARALLWPLTEQLVAGSLLPRTWRGGMWRN